MHVDFYMILHMYLLYILLYMLKGRGPLNQYKFLLTL